MGVFLLKNFEREKLHINRYLTVGRIREFSYSKFLKEKSSTLTHIKSFDKTSSILNIEYKDENII